MNARKIVLLLVASLGIYSSVAAREVVSINNNWKFYLSKENSADYARTISLPHTWAYDSNMSLVSTQPTTANYIKDLYTPESWSGKRIFIKFYGVESVADLMINGQYVGEHRGGSTAFTFEITKFVNIASNNRIHVVVNNAPQSDVLPTSHEEDRYGGIYRDVEIIVTDQTNISPLYYGSDGLFVESHTANNSVAEGVVRAHINSSRNNATAQVVLSIFDASNSIVFQKAVAKVKSNSDPVEIPFSVSNPKLWSPQEPNLYNFVVKVIDGDNSDQVEVTSGFRKIELSDVGMLTINGEQMPFRGVSLYHDYPHVGGAASRRDVERDMRFVEELGANAIHSVTHPHHQYLYELCDSRGMLVWIDLPFVKAPFLSDIAYYPTERFHQSGRNSLQEIIAQNYNHPSVVMWGIFSLLSTRGDNPIPYIQELNKEAKKLDATRPTVAISDQDGQINSITDLIVWKQSLGWDRGQFSDVDLWSELLHTKWSSMRSAVTFGQQGRLDQQSSADQYKSEDEVSVTTWSPEGRARIFHEEYAKRVSTDSLFWGVCLNSMFDFKSSRNALGESNTGLMTFDRRNRKDIFYLYKANWNKNSPTLHIADSRNNVSNNELHKLVVYASDTLPPTLYTVSDTIPLSRVAPWQFEADSILLNKGDNKLIVRQGSLADSVTITLQNATQQSRSTRR